MSPRDIDAAPLEAGPPGLMAPLAPRPPTALLVAMTGVGPFAMQIVVPSLPAIAAGLAAPYATVQLTLTLFLVTVALGQLVYGPLSDRYGRRPLLLVGLALFLAGSVLAALAPSVELLVLGRVLQAGGSCAGLVLGRAIIRDAYPRDRAASVLGLVSTAMAVAPMLAPLLGSVLEERFGWRAGMVACAAFGAPLLVATALGLRETLARPIDLPGMGGLVRAYAAVARAGAFRAYAAITSFSTGVFFAFIAGAPLVAIAGLGVSPTAFGAAMIAISGAWMSGTFLAARLSVRLGVTRMLRIGTAITAVGGVVAVLAVALLPASMLALFGPMAIVALGNGISQPNAIAAAVSVRPQLAGTASGLVGAVQMGTGAAMTVAVGVMEDGSGIATAAWMLVMALATRVALAMAPPEKAGQTDR